MSTENLQHQTNTVDSTVKNTYSPIPSQHDFENYLTVFII